MIRLLVCILVPALLYCQDISSLLPDSIAGFKQSGEAELYKGQDLYKLIDGGADIFFEYGFVQVVRQRYADEDDSNNIDIEVYEMEDSAASFGIFSLFTNETGQPVSSLEEAFRGNEYLLMRRGNYYVSITILGNTASAFPYLETAAREIKGKIKHAGIPAIAYNFMNYVNERIVYINGSLGLYNLSPVNFGSELNIHECIFYQDSINKVFVIKHTDEQELNKNYTTAINILKSNKNFQILSSKEKETSFNGANNIDLVTIENYLVVVFSGRQDIQKKELNKLKSFLGSEDLNN